jgi:hypothetical protein
MLRKLQKVQLPFAASQCATDTSILTRNKLIFAGSEAVAAVFMKSSVYWDVTQYGIMKFDPIFGGTCRLHLQRRRINQARNQDSTLNQMSIYLL